MAQAIYLDDTMLPDFSMCAIDWLEKEIRSGGHTKTKPQLGAD